MPQTSEPLWYIVWITLIGVGGMLIGLIIARVLKKRLRREEPAQAFTLDDLRQMRARGQITGAEYEAMRAAIIADVTAGAGSAAGKEACDQDEPEAGGGRAGSAPDGGSGVAS